MAQRTRRGGFGAVLAALFGLGALSAVGFAVGLVLGAIWEEPGLVIGHLAGETEEVPWASEAAAGDSAAPPPAAPVPRAEPGPVRTPPAPPGAPQVRLPTAEPATPAKPAEVSAAPPLAGGFAIQVGAFAQSDSAERLALRLREKGMGVYVSPSTQEGAARWRVRVGPFPSRAEAERLAARIKTDEKLPTWVLQEGGR